MNHMNPDNYYEEKLKSRTALMGLTLKLMFYAAALASLFFLLTSCSIQKPLQQPCDYLIDRATGEETPVYDCN